MIFEGLWSRPLHWNLATMRNIVILILEIPRQTKVCNLWSEEAQASLGISPSFWEKCMAGPTLTCHFGKE